MNTLNTTVLAAPTFERKIVSPQKRQWRQRYPWQAFASALGIEIAVVGLFIAWMATHPPKLPETIVPLAIELLPAPELEKPLAPTPATPPTPKSQPMQTVRPPPRTTVQHLATATPPAPLPTQTPAVATLPNTPVATAPAPTATTPAVANASVHQPAPSVPAQPPSTPSVDPAVAYNAKLAAAVQTAFEVPVAAEALGFKGRARVEFTLHDGAVSAIRVVQTSGLGAADRAAIRAVQSASYPAPPPELRGKEGTYHIWVACL